MKIIKTTQYKIAQEEEGFFYSQIAETLQEMEKDIPSEIKKIQALSKTIFALEKEILSLAQTQTGVSEGQDYYGKDYFSQQIAGNDVVQRLNSALDTFNIWDLHGILSDYIKLLSNMRRDLKWGSKNQSDESLSQSQEIYTGA